MNSYPLYRSGEANPVAYGCGTCNRIQTEQYMPVAVGGKRLTSDERLNYARAHAERCCNWRCKICGEPAFSEFQTICRKHLSEEQDAVSAAKEAAAFAKAKDVTDMYVGPFMFNDRYFEDTCSLLDHFDCNYGVDDPWPEYVWVPSEIALSIDAEHIIENALDGHYEGAADMISDDERKRLQELLDEWCERTGVVSWEENHAEYVRIQKPVEA